MNFSHSKSIDVQYDTSGLDQIIIICFSDSSYLVFVAIATKALILLPLVDSGVEQLQMLRQSWNSEFVVRLYQDQQHIFVNAYAYVMPPLVVLYRGETIMLV